MKLPNAKSRFVKREDDPAYMRRLFDKTGLDKKNCAEKIGVALSTFYCWVDEESKVQWPYSAQYALEQLAAAARKSEVK